MKFRIGFATLLTALAGQFFAPAAIAQPFPNGVEALFMGHSFFIPISRSFDEIVSDSGAYPRHEYHAVMSGGKTGTPRALWESRSKRRNATQILSSGDIDLVAFTHGGMFGSEQADYQRWIDLALEYNPNTSFMIGSIWMTGGTNISISNFRTQTQASSDYGFGMIQALRRANPGVDFYHVAHGPMMVQMREDFEAGELDDISRLVGGKTRDDVLFTDDKLGHAGQMAKDMMALVWLNELYGIKQGRVSVDWNTHDTNRLLRKVVRMNAGYN